MVCRCKFEEEEKIHEYWQLERYTEDLNGADLWDFWIGVKLFGNGELGLKKQFSAMVTSYMKCSKVLCLHLSNVDRSGKIVHVNVAYLKDCVLGGDFLTRSPRRPRLR